MTTGTRRLLARLTVQISRLPMARWPSPNLGVIAMYLRVAALARALAVILLICPVLGWTQSTTYKEDFTGTGSENQWFFYNGACLTAGSATSLTSPGYIPGCVSVLASYYYPVLTALGKPNSDSYLTGGDLGFLGGSSAPSTYANQKPDSPPVAGNGNTGGALRFTNGAPYGFHENGAIVSNFVFPTSQGLQITFKTVTYHGDNQGGHGADGISFYLLDGCMPITGGTVPAGCPSSKVYGTNTFPGIGAWGGSLAYTCSNANLPYDGLAGGYLGLGIDEWGNFLNGSTNTLGESGTTASGDNTASGGGYQPGRIGLRGAGNITWQTLTTAYGIWKNTSTPYYPSSLTTSCYINTGTLTNGLCKTSSGQLLGTDAMMAVKATCSNGTLYNYANNSGSVTSSSVTSPKNAGATSLTNTNNTAGIVDYTALANAYKVVTAFSIANESATQRGSTLVANTSTNDANPITYKLKITPDNLLSLSYSFNGGSFQPVISGQDITAANGALPNYFRFGFAGSTGGSTNIHEVMCFKAAPSETSNSSGGINVYQNPTVKTGTQLYLAYYNPNDWTGQLTATPVLFDTVNNTVTIATTPTWDARCVLTGVDTTTGPCSTGATSMTAESPTSRVMLTWNGSAGIPFEWASITSAQQGALDSGDSAQTSGRLDFLRGVRTNEVSSSGTCPQFTGTNKLPCFRSRNSVLGDIVDSSPTWVGPPQTYGTSVTFKDALHSSITPPEAGVSYQSYITGKQGRQNVVYVGANDGFVHGFRAGSLDANGNMVANSSTPNDGYEVLAYMPGAVLNIIHSSTADYDYANQQYSHQWFVDATPTTGDLFYKNAWHTWLVGGLGAGGAAFYALDVTDPSIFSESNASSIVVGEWTPSTITCQNYTSCGGQMGTTYGTPQIRRFHNGQWGVIFGNGYTTSNKAGIFIMLIDPSSGAQTFYYLQAVSSGGTTANGIGSPSSLDMDLDHVVDYIYAGDLRGNIWRFDVTDTNPAKWALSDHQPLFTTPNNQPITGALSVGTMKEIRLSNFSGQILDNTKPERVMIGFGTGQQVPQSLTSPATYASGQQYLFGIWDYNFTNWNTVLMGSPQAISMTAPQSVTMTTLMKQTISTGATSSGVATRTVTNNSFCYAVVSPLDTNNCSQPGTYFGWYIPLPGTSEQAIFNPVLSPDGEFVVNTLIPPQDTPLSCNTNSTTTGFTMGVTYDTGAGQNSGTSTNPTGYFRVSTTNGVIGGVDGIQLNGTGIPMFLSSGQKGDNNSEYLITQTSGGSAPPLPTNRHTIVTGKRVNWVQRR
jgi:type IV pilus assembly protein PilY1